MLFGYEVKDQIDHKYLQIGSVETGIFQTFPRAKSFMFDANENVALFKLTPHKSLIDSINLAKQNKLKGASKAKPPHDSLGIYFFEFDTTFKFPNIISFQTARDSGNLFAFLLKSSPFPQPKVEEKTPSKKPLWLFFNKEAQPEKPIKKHKPTPQSLIVGNCYDTSFVELRNIQQFSLSSGNGSLAIVQANQDTLDSLSVQIYFQSDSTKTIFKTSGKIKHLNWDEQGNQLAFLHSTDTNKNKQYNLFYYKLGSDTVSLLIGDTITEIDTKFGLSEHQKPYFSEYGNRLFWGYGKRPKPDQKDTLLDIEKPKFDLWSWTDTRLQPHQLKQLKRDRNKTYLAYFDILNNKNVILADTTLDNIRVFEKGESYFGYAANDSKYIRSVSWQWPMARDIYVIDVATGNATLLLDSHRFAYNFSPDGKYLTYYKDETKSWFLMDVASKKTVDISSQIPSVFFNEEHDTPNPPRPYGIEGWSENSNHIILKDEFDLWIVATQEPTNFYSLTKGYGRKNNIRFSLEKQNTEQDYFNLNNYQFLTGFNETTKESAIIKVLRGSNPEVLFQEKGFNIRLARTTRFSNNLIFSKQNFQTFPDLYTTDFGFKEIHRISNLNQNQKEYLWGTSNLVKFKKDDGEELEGLVFLPENYDASKKYPAIVYYYEKYADQLNRYFAPRLSASIINPSHYVSNGYIVLIPDITYKDGYPGKSALEAINAATDFLIKNYAVNPEKIGLQGQSWGGYQTAYVVTQTNRFAAAMAGAPVSNMTSAYGGIRWGSGYSRMFQYENTQSRIGKTLWEAPELYMYNSPVFYANQVNTPLLMMHNDNDGAVPWYQGIEYFVALRRLNKPVWMLTYNNEEHNLRKWPNKEDLTIRMMQFFDYCLKDAPPPRWLIDGIPAIKKGEELRYELLEE